MKRFTPAARIATQLGGIFLTLITFAQIGSAAPARENPKSRALEAFRPDQIIVKLSEDRAKSLDLGDGSALSALLLRHGAVGQRRAFAGSGSSHPSITTAAQGAERARQRFAKRAARAPRDQELPDLENIFVVQLAGSTDILHAIAELAAQLDVVYAEPNFLYHVMEAPLPDEPFIPDDRYLSEDGVHFSEGAWGQAHPDLWGIEKIRAIEAWNKFDLDGSGDFDACLLQRDAPASDPSARATGRAPRGPRLWACSWRGRARWPPSPLRTRRGLTCRLLWQDRGVGVEVLCL